MEEVKPGMIRRIWSSALAGRGRPRLRPGSLAWTAAFLLCLFAAGSGPAQPSRSAGAASSNAGKETRNLATLQSEARALEKAVDKLKNARSRLFPARPAILVDTVENRICIVRGERVLACGKCSTGSGAELRDTATGRRWVFDTPRGHFSAKGKISNPVWRRPDWAFVEEGLPVPKNAAERHVAEVLGDYAIGFGDGFFIHGTLYTRLLGANVTHGCIRAEDEILEKIFAFAQPGTSIWIY